MLARAFFLSASHTRTHFARRRVADAIFLIGDEGTLCSLKPQKLGIPSFCFPGPQGKAPVRKGAGSNPAATMHGGVAEWSKAPGSSRFILFWAQKRPMGFVEGMGSPGPPVLVMDVRSSI